MSIFSKNYGLSIRAAIICMTLLVGVNVKLSTLSAQCATTTAYSGTVTTGGQNWTGQLGQEFTNTVPIIISQLGVFDDARVAGITGSIAVGIVSDAGAIVVGPVTITGSGDPLVNSYRMRNIAPVTLVPGTYHIVAVGFGATDANGNSGLGDGVATTNSGGILTFGLPRYDNTTTFTGRPTTVDVGGPSGRYHAGTFTFAPVQPILQTTLNGTVITTDNNGVDNTATVTVCNDNVVNITLGTFTDLAGSSSSDFTVKAYMEYSGTNVNFTGVVPASWGFPIARRLSDFAGYTAILSKVNANLPASATLRWRIFVDSDLDGVIDAGECPGDWASYTITFESQVPVITCPPNITMNAAATECSVTVNYAAPTVSDAPCTTVPTFVQTAGLPSGSAFPIGTTVNTFLATDASGNTNTCSFTVTIIDYAAPPLGCKDVQFSLDEDCEGELEPTAVLTGWEGPGGTVLLGCESFYTINVVDKNGFDLGETLGRDQLGKTLQYTITHTSGFTCWGNVTVEDKIKPTITCRNAQVHCLTDLTTVALPIVTDNCHATAKLVNEVHQVLDCDPLYIGTVTRTWVAVDDFGNESLPCTSVISLLRPSAAGIVAPLVATVKLSCSSGYATDDKGLGYPSPDETGIPTLGGTGLYPSTELNMLYCNAYIDYKDEILVDTDCKKRIRRSWTIYEWWCSTMNPIFIGVQMIDIVDETAPIIPVQNNITVTTQTRSCTAAVQLPKLDITDNCNKVYRVYVNANNGSPSGYVNGNGGLMELSVGTHTITYTAFDNCTNSSSMSYRITVRDETDPVAICDQFATVSIKANGYTDVTAQAIDDGSFDECGPVTLKVRRMEDPCHFGHDTAWYDKVGFCCLDANTSRMVQLLVTDQGGNTNICMVNVNVQEKVTPTLTCPADLTVNDCLFTFDPSLAGTNAAFGEAVINDNCPANNILNHGVQDNRNMCGVGTVVRNFSVQQANTIYQTCSQTITFRNLEPFYGDTSIVWPKDYLAIGQCSFSGLLPETLPDSSSTPKFTEDACDLVGSRYEDLIFPFTTNGACYKVIRKWTVIDWCQTDDNGDNLTWTHEQEIKVMDNNPPVITVPVSTVLFETLNCFSDDITLSASAVDCTPADEIKWKYVIYQDGEVISSGNASSVTDEFEVGDYSITFTAEDRCGNVSEKSYTFTVVTTKAPTAICKNGLASSLVLMDTDNNGSGDTPMVMLAPKFFDNKSNHPCGYDIKLSFSADVNDTLVTYDCSSVTSQTVQLWVTDENGNTSYCETFVDIQDNDNLCPSTALSVISGKTTTEDNKDITNVTVDMEGSEQTTSTDQNGRYVFAPIANGVNYQIIPSKDGDDLNGVSTMDLVMIQRHILGLEKLNSPYKLIAADVNNSRNITASDLTELRKLILGVNKSFANNTSWRFVDGSKKFADPNDPWAGGLTELYDIDKLNFNMDINFIGVKIGDVNNNVVANNLDNNADSRSTQQFKITDRKVMRGEVIEIPVTASNANTWYGLQAQWEAKGLIIRDMKPGAIQFDVNEYMIPTINQVGISVAMAEGQRIAKDRILFTIEAEVLKSGMLSEMLSLGNEIHAEMYNDEFKTESLSLSWRRDVSEFGLTNVTPNPWNTQTQISFFLPETGMVSFKVKDYTGKNIISTIDQYQSGQNVIQLNRADIGHSGVYVYELRFGDKVLTGKMILIE